MNFNLNSLMIKIYSSQSVDKDERISFLLKISAEANILF